IRRSCPSTTGVPRRQRSLPPLRPSTARSCRLTARGRCRPPPVPARASASSSTTPRSPRTSSTPHRTPNGRSPRENATGPGALSVYQVAHQRIHGQPPREGLGARSDSLPPYCRFRGTSGRPSTGHARARDPSALAELHQRELLENWSLARVGETLHEIEPLQ